jgi:hypothetical protein
MTTARLTPRPWTALAAVAATLLLAAHGASAAEPASMQVDIAGQMSLRDACPSGDADLAEALAGAWEDAVKPSTVAVTFEVRRHSVYGVAPQTDSARAFHQIRRAVQGLRCDGGDDAAHTVRFVVRFVDRAQGVRVAMVTAPSKR